MRKQALTGLGVATVMTSALVLPGAAHAIDACVPSQGTPASFTEWEVTRATDWFHDATVPADPDGHSDGNDPANLTMIGSTPITQKHVVQAAIPATEAQWQRYSLKGAYHDAFGPSETPPAPDVTPLMWQENVAGDPHNIGKPGAYYRSNDNSGNGDWFYLQLVTDAVPGQPEISHLDYQYPVLERTYTPAKPATSCPSTDPGTNPSTDPGTDPGTDPATESGTESGQVEPAVEETVDTTAQATVEPPAPSAGGDTGAGDEGATIVLGEQTSASPSVTRHHSVSATAPSAATHTPVVHGTIATRGPRHQLRGSTALVPTVIDAGL